MPQILLDTNALAAIFARVFNHAVARMPAAHARGLHCAAGSKIRWPKRNPLHTRTGRGNGLDILHPFCGFKNRMDQDRLGHTGFCLKLGKQLIKIVDIPRPLDHWQHDHIKLIANLCYQGRNIIETPRTFQRIDTAPQARAERGKISSLCHFDEAFPRGNFLVGGDSIFKIAENNIGFRRHCGHFGADFFDMRRNEMDHPFEPDRQVTQRWWRANSKRLEKLARGLVCHIWLLNWADPMAKCCTASISLFVSLG